MANVIKTSRLVLVPLTSHHLEAFHAVWSDPQATQWSLHGRNATLEASEEWMAGILRAPQTDNYRSWAVYISDALEQHQCIGIVTLLPKDRPGGEGTWELGYLFRPEWWGFGYATESCAAAIESLRNDLDANITGYKPRVVAWVSPKNSKSSKVVEKLGFRWIELKEFGDAAKIKLDGQWRDDGVFVYERML